MCEPISIGVTTGLLSGVGTAAGTSFAIAGSTTLGAIAVGAVGGGIAMSAAGMYQQGQSAKAQGKYQEAIYRNNAIAAEYQAQDAARRAEVEGDKINRMRAGIIGQGRTAYAAGNVMLGSGSPETWELDTALAANQDLEMLQHNTRMQHWGIRNQAADYLAQGKLASYSGKQAAKVANTQAAGSLLSGAGQLGLKFAK